MSTTSSDPTPTLTSPDPHRARALTPIAAAFVGRSAAAAEIASRHGSPDPAPADTAPDRRGEP